MDKKRKQNILSKWEAINIDTGIRSHLFYKFLGLFFIILIVILYRQMVRNKYSKRVEKKNKEIQELNNSLQEKVKTQVAILREKDSLLIKQSNYAQMGEMINMIAHQWRQPLNAMSASAIKLSMLNELGEVNKEDIDKASGFIQKKTQDLSTIINDFMNFNKETNDAQFSLLDSINNVHKIIQAQFISRSIEININIDKELKVFHNQKAIEHSLINIILNARDAFDTKVQNDKTISIYTKTKDNNILLIIEDNAGGIPKDIIDKIFNPYFTTKEQGKGTGIAFL